MFIGWTSTMKFEYTIGWVKMKVFIESKKKILRL